MKFRKKPVVIDAMAYLGPFSVDGMREEWGEAFTNKSWLDTMGLRIMTAEGLMQASIGDYIIKGVKGEFYPCKPDIFALSYEAAE